jgi:hypothetical protein
MRKNESRTGKKSANSEITGKEYALLQSIFDQLSKKNRKIILDKAETLAVIQKSMEED